MINNTKIGEGMQSQNKEVSVEIADLMTEIINFAKAALHTAHERHAVEQPLVMGISKG